jgi:mono/diheme cytochrome c family protein
MLANLLINIIYILVYLNQIKGDSAARDRVSTQSRGIPSVRSDRASHVAVPDAVIQLYGASCLQCHDVDGRGEIARDLFPTIPDLTDPVWQASRGDADLRRSILDGKGKSMPRMRDKLGAIDVGRMVDFVRAFRDGNQVVDEESETAPAVAPALPETAGRSTESTADRVRESRSSMPEKSDRLFRRFCVMCHGRDGKGSEAGGQLPGIPDFTAPAWHLKSSDARLVVSVLEGKGSNMPAFQEKLSREQIRELITYVRSFNPAQQRPVAKGRDDFEARYRALRGEFEDLKRQIHELPPPSRATGSTRR